MSHTFSLVVTYSQIAVFDPDLENPFNDWTSQHIKQGFSWRLGSVSFRTLDSGKIQVEVKQANDITMRSDTVRAIRVPFSVGSSGRVEIAVIDSGPQINIPPGNYSLIFETGYDNNSIMWCRLSFASGEERDAAILRADTGLSPTYLLLMEAEPALP